VKQIKPWLILVVGVSLTGCSKGDPQAEARVKLLTERVAKLEAEQEQIKEVADFVRPIMEQQKQAEQQQAASEPDPNARFAVAIEGDAFDGPADAPVTVIKAFDFACPYCERVSPLLDDIVKKYDGKVRVVYKNFVVHPDTVLDAHLAGCAANKQGKFKAYKDAFWEKGFRAYAQSRDPSMLGKDNIMKIAKGAGLDVAKLQSDMSSDDCRARVQADMAELSKFGVNGTPSFFVNGKFTMFSSPGAFTALIDKELGEVEASGVPAAEYYQKVVMAQGEKAFKSAGQ